MLYALLVLVIGLSISAVAAFYSIVGLTTIFSGAVIPVIIMGSVLEVGKLITASWLYRNWKKAGFLMKTYLSIAVVILMFITSMGIFGFLSKAHIEQTSQTGNSTLQVELLDQQLSREQTKIVREEKRIADANVVIEQLDKAVETLINYDRINGPRGAIAVRTSQKEEREALNTIIDEANDDINKISQNIADIQDKKFVLEKKQVEFEVEVGPIKYIAELVYGKEKAKDLLDEAVRAVILILIVVFDPLAVLLLIAANISLEQVKESKKKEKTTKTYDVSNSKPKKQNKVVDLKDLDDLITPELKELASEPPGLPDLDHDDDEEEEFVPPAGPPTSTRQKDLHREIMLHNDIYGKLSEEEKEEVVPTKKVTDWTEKLTEQSVSEDKVKESLENAYAEINSTANIPFNLNSPEGDSLKRIIYNNIAKTLFGSNKR